MKYFLLLILLGLVFFMLGVKRARPPARPAKPEPAESAAPPTMLGCAQCGLHMPAGEMLPGQGGVFCSAEHRARFEAEHGGQA